MFVKHLKSSEEVVSELSISIDFRMFQIVVSGTGFPRACRRIWGTSYWSVDAFHDREAYAVKMNNQRYVLKRISNNFACDIEGVARVPDRQRTNLSIWVWSF